MKFVKEIVLGVVLVSAVFAILDNYIKAQAELTDTFSVEGGLYRTLANGSAVLVYGNSSFPKMIPPPEGPEHELHICQGDDGEDFVIC